MTNADKFQEIFKEFATEVWAFPEKDFLTWLNAEYKEPATKNDLAVDKTFYEQMVEYCNEHFLVLVEKDVWEDARKALTTKNDLGVDFTINGLDDFIEFGKKAFGVELTIKNDLGVDLISRADALALYCDKCGLYNCISKCASYRAVEKMPSITPQEPTTQERQAESDKFDAAFQDGYNNGYAQAKFDYEQKPTIKNDLGVDAVSRQAVRDTIFTECSGTKLDIDFAKVLLLQRAIKALPSITPQLSSELAKNSKKLEKDFGELDCISRQAVLEQAYAYGNGLEPDGYCVNVEDIQALPLITSIRSKGHWIKHNTPNNKYYYDCSLCGCIAPCTETADSYLWKLSDFCPGCGADMREIKK